MSELVVRMTRADVADQHPTTAIARGFDLEAISQSAGEILRKRNRREAKTFVHCGAQLSRQLRKRVYGCFRLRKVSKTTLAPIHSSAA